MPDTVDKLLGLCIAIFIFVVIVFSHLDGASNKITPQPDFDKIHIKQAVPIENTPIKTIFPTKTNPIISLSSKNSYFYGNVSGEQIFYIQRLPSGQYHNIFQIWSTVCVTIKSNKPCVVSEGLSLKEIQYDDGIGPWLIKLITRFNTNVDKEACNTYRFVPNIYKDFYINVETSDALLEVNYHFELMSYYLIALCATGLLIALSAKYLSKSEVFHYASGVSLGLIGSILLVFLVIARYVPKKKIAILTGLTGTSIWLFLAKWFSENISELNETFRFYVVVYLVCASVVSMVICYTQGPLQNPKYTTVIEYLLYFSSSICLYNGFSEKTIFVSFSVVIAMVMFTYSLYGYVYSPLRRGFDIIGNRFFPKKRKLLSQDEYARQADEFTQKQLNDLKKYVQSPDCNSWRLISRLKSPEKFAKFVNNEECHVSEDELSSYERYNISNDLVDDDEEDEEFEASLTA